MNFKRNNCKKHNIDLQKYKKMKMEIFTFCVLTQNERLNFSFVKDIHLSIADFGDPLYKYLSYSNT